MSVDVVIIGAGAAGLTALSELDQRGVKVVCVEARERIGGRIFTIRDPLCPLPVELGAEFIHGRPPEIWNFLKAAALSAYDCCEKAVRLRDGKVQDKNDPWDLVDRILTDMERAATRKDRTFAEFLAGRSYPENAKKLAISYVEGFNAARQDIIGIASLAKDERAADAIDGDRSFRNLAGYDSLMHVIVRGVDDLPHKLKLNSIVERIEWRAGAAAVHFCSAATRHKQSVHCRCVVITVPLGVLQASSDAPGAIAFDPEPGEILAAARKLQFGEVVRLILRFRKPFWERNEKLAEAGFFFSDEHFFPTWWTPLPIRAPILTGWSAGPHTDGLAGEPQLAIIQRAVESLSRITGTSAQQIENLLGAAYYHDWQADPFSRGAYSYVPAGALPARAVLARPVAGTLFFAGEATEQNGHSATVHGAIASGRRAARQVLARFHTE